MSVRGADQEHLIDKDNVQTSLTVPDVLATTVQN